MFSWSAACPERSRGADLFTLFTPSFEGSLEGLPPLRRRGGHGQVAGQGEIAVSVDDRKIRVKFRLWRLRRASQWCPPLCFVARLDRQMLLWRRAKSASCEPRNRQNQGAWSTSRTPDKGSEPLSSSTSTSTHVSSAMFLHHWLSREPILQCILQREMPGEKFSRLAFAFLSCSAIPTSLSTGTGGGNPHPYPERKLFSACRPKGTCPVTRLIRHVGEVTQRAADYTATMMRATAPISRTSWTFGIRALLACTPFAQAASPVHAKSGHHEEA